VFAEGECLRRESVCGGRVVSEGEYLCRESVSGRLCVKRLTCYVFSFKREALATVALTNEK
jgi:hypothetical protein